MFFNKQNIDKITYRKENKEKFVPLIDHYRKTSQPMKEKSSTASSGGNIVKVFIRKRPMFEREVSNGEFDVVTCKKDGIVVHECRMHPSLKPMLSYIESIRFSLPCGRVYNEESTTHDLYQESVKPLLDHVISGNFGTVFCFGQTGSGKTFTMSGMVNMLAKDLLATLPKSKKIAMTCVELIGEQVYDLLNDHKDVSVRDSGDGEFILQGNVWVDIKESTTLQKTYHLAGSLRETHATKVNSNSSRSHYICRLSVRDSNDTEFARLTLCDLAGSERNIDSNQHDSERLKETALINTSLMALKDVMRALVMRKQEGNQVRIPYRASKLTRILKDGFESNEKPTQTILISTLSPQACDLEHSIGTLKTVCEIGNHSHSEEGKMVFRDVIPQTSSSNHGQLKPLAKMDAKETTEWLSTVKGGILKSSLKKFPRNMDGKTLTKQAEKRLQQILENDLLGSQLRAAIIEYTNKCNDQKVQHIEKLKNTK